MKSFAQMFQKDNILEESIGDIVCMNTVRFPQVMQALMFLLKIDRQAICEPETNLLQWKKARNFVHETVERMVNYTVLG